MIRFDHALPALCALLRDHQTLSQRDVTVVRDPAGRLTAVVPDDAMPEAELSALAERLHGRLARFSPGTRRVLLKASDLIDPADVLGSPDRISLDPETYGEQRWLVDRVLTNQDWLRRPVRATPRVPTSVGFSIKGGVGRSTALALLAWHFARQGRKVLLADLDLEAPGLGPMLLPELPELGMVDWCVESLVGQADGELFEQMWRPAPLAVDEPGAIWVVPAHGQRTEDYVAKVGRAYLPTVDAEGRSLGLADRFASFIACAANRIEPPDVVLLDARAGLHDIGSAAVTQLGAEVFLFARDDGSSWEAYRRLFAHLRNSRSVSWGAPEDDLRWRLKMVAAQSEPTEESVRGVITRSYASWEPLYDMEEVAGGSPMTFASDDVAAPHFPLRVLFDPRVRGLDLVSADKRPDWGFIESTFGDFFAGAERRILEGEP